ncbi:hypothetical protein [Streptomyces sp. NPDC004266]|uniref:hypothetical protein n=1 Tax=Streptomyces sp. NPDC004266 TaxID=3364693 RepID=UPI00367DC569
MRLSAPGRPERRAGVHRWADPDDVAVGAGPDLPGAETVRLVVTDAGDVVSHDHADRAEATVACRPEPQTAHAPCCRAVPRLGTGNTPRLIRRR